MGDSNVIYEAGQSIVECFKKRMTPEPIALAESIGLCLPHDPGDFQLTVWIYNIEEHNDTGRGTGYIKSPSNPNIEIFAPTQLRLSVLITAHSKAPLHSRFSDMCRIIGRAMQIMKDNPTLESRFLVGSLLHKGVSPQVTCLKLTADEVAKVWNNAGKPINPSFAIQISSLEMDSSRTRKVMARVVDANIVVKEKVTSTKKKRGI